MTEDAYCPCLSLLVLNALQSWLCTGDRTPQLTVHGFQYMCVCTICAIPDSGEHCETDPEKAIGLRVQDFIEFLRVEVSRQ